MRAHLGTVAQNWQRVSAQVDEVARRSGASGAVRLVAVSKTHPAEAVLEAFEAGARDFGESYVQELVAKRDEVSRLLGPRAEAIRWHFIGRLQSNKLKKLGAVSLVHAIDRASLLDALEGGGGQVLPVLLQVRLGGEETKAGFDPEAIEEAVGRALAMEGVEVRGLMTIPPPCRDASAQRGHFRHLRALLEGCRARFGTSAEGLRELSMGMSQDFGLAVEEGATLVRVGTAIFGDRG